MCFFKKSPTISVIEDCWGHILSSVWRTVKYFFAFILLAWVTVISKLLCCGQLLSARVPKRKTKSYCLLIQWKSVLLTLSLFPRGFNWLFCLGFLDTVAIWDAGWSWGWFRWEGRHTSSTPGCSQALSVEVSLCNTDKVQNPVPIILLSLNRK